MEPRWSAHFESFFSCLLRKLHDAHDIYFQKKAQLDTLETYRAVFVLGISGSGSSCLIFSFSSIEAVMFPWRLSKESVAPKHERHITSDGQCHCILVGMGWYASNTPQSETLVKHFYGHG